jgi:hypothetical protein
MTNSITSKPKNRLEVTLQCVHMPFSTDAPTPRTKSPRRGTAKDPIEVETLETPSSHKRLDRTAGYFAPMTLQYRPSRLKLAPTLYTPGGAIIPSGAIGGHQSHEIYQMLATRQEVSGLPGSINVTPQVASAARQSRIHTAAPIPQKPHRHQFIATQPMHHVYPTNVLQKSLRAHNSYPTFYQTPTNGYPLFPNKTRPISASEPSNSSSTTRVHVPENAASLTTPMR